MPLEIAYGLCRVADNCSSHELQHFFTGCLGKIQPTGVWLGSREMLQMSITGVDWRIQWLGLLQVE